MIVELKKPMVICPVGNNQLANAVHAVVGVLNVRLVANAMMASS
jgi:hypothetical protein